MYYVLVIQDGVRSESYHKDGEVVYTNEEGWPAGSYRTEFFLRNGFLGPREVMTDSCLINDSFLVDKDGNVSPDLIACPTDMPIRCFVFCSGGFVAIDLTGTAWYLDRPPKQIHATWPVTSVAGVDNKTIVLAGPASWKVSVHGKCSQPVKEVFRQTLLSFRRVNVNFVLYLRVAELL